MPESQTMDPKRKPEGLQGGAEAGPAGEKIRGRRFAFGKNWAGFLKLLDERRIRAAEGSLQEMLGAQDLQGLSFLDVGCGSGLFSLAARRLGARVHSFDYDPQCAGCAQELKRRFFREDPFWTVGVGSVLNREFMDSLGRFDIIYCWGVLHHTGGMWEAMENVMLPLAEGGRLFLAIYNTNNRTPIHLRIKRLYVFSPRPVRAILAGAYFTGRVFRFLGKDILAGKNPLARYGSSYSPRGMDWWTDSFDWLGGYPFETALPEEVFAFFHSHGLILEKLKTANGRSINNEFIFKKERA